ncbi:hypothetical protein OV079_53225 [Nannocystis pusilla]|uniref:histidine kinase n=1 Tax=Nannocystis pusilla TaxID=889268 RepID=A0A9X3F1D1_9BACT|nr:histidine kinase dimerization/phospho-acceptor domain-containing protein [Nannocystis pusilla]MCY1014138.1 hypothetical protein [Nannocystis pusilla]
MSSCSPRRSPRRPPRPSRAPDHHEPRDPHPAQRHPRHGRAARRYAGLPAQAHTYAQTIKKSGDILLSLVNDILDFSKIEAGKLELEQAAFSPRECVEVADIVAGMAREKAIDLAAIVAHDVPAAVLGDPVRLRQILLNLATNALKFTRAAARWWSAANLAPGTC